MNKTVLAILALLIATNSLLAQFEGGWQSTSAGLEEILDLRDVDYHVDRIAMENVKLTAVDVVAGNLRMLFNPTRAFDYWPEYQYDYNAVATFCQTSAVNFDLRNRELGTIAITTGNNIEAIILDDPEGGFCNLLPINENSASSETIPVTAFFIASRPIPARELEFERVNLEFVSNSS